MFNLKYWDCIDHKWVLFFLPVKQPFHNCFIAWYWGFKTDKEKCLKWGEVWVIWFKVPIKKV